MKQTVKYLIFFILISITGLTGCVKDSCKDYIIGTWKLDRITSYDSAGYLKFSILDYSENNIIYEFRKNKKLIVTSSISGNSQINQYSYKCECKENFYTTNGTGVLVKIGKENYSTYLGRGISNDLTNFETMSLFVGTKPKKIMDESDIDIMEQGHQRNWRKEFLKLN